nr:MAG TPA: hypothetical protein [Caudoviricetes sp.]
MRFKVHSRKLATVFYEAGIEYPSIRFWYQNPLATPPKDVSYVLYATPLSCRWYHDNNTDVLLYTYHCPALLSVAAERL